jgi:hypothetical protein
LRSSLVSHLNSFSAPEEEAALRVYESSAREPTSGAYNPNVSSGALARRVQQIDLDPRVKGEALPERTCDRCRRKAMRIAHLWRRAIHRNLSSDERYVRLLVGGALIMFAVVVPFVWAWVGLYPLATGLFGSSPIYRVLEIQRKHNLGA